MNLDSKKATFEEKDKYLLPVTFSNEIKEIYRTLDVLNKKANTIQLKMNKKIKKMIGRNTSITYYDVTNYYFETGSNDEDFIDESTGEIILDCVKTVFQKRLRRPPSICKNKGTYKCTFPSLFHSINNNSVTTVQKIKIRK
ncbi:hypothetical protein [Fusobacterium sp. PH5-44]|uniref:hypothetical protein n=1 Tax=Fusobacterium sp. PH5-44 TaxID=2940518 RepID=UPI003D1BAE23